MYVEITQESQLEDGSFLKEKKSGKQFELQEFFSESNEYYLYAVDEHSNDSPKVTLQQLMKNYLIEIVDGGFANEGAGPSSN